MNYFVIPLLTVHFVIPSEARNLLLLEMEKRKP